MNLAIKLFKDCPHRDEYKKGIPLDWIAEVIENCDIPPDDKYIIVNEDEYKAYLIEKLPTYQEWERQLELQKTSLEATINACLELYASFPLGIRIQFEATKNKVVECIQLDDLNTAKEIISTVSLPAELCEARALFLNLLN